MSPRKTEALDLRQAERFACYRGLTVTYEGSSMDVPVRAPDLSTRGMFINTAGRFPVGAVLKVRFWLTRTDFEVNARGEVRYCLPGVGVGMEFLQLPLEAQHAIQEELALVRTEAACR